MVCYCTHVLVLMFLCLHSLTHVLMSRLSCPGCHAHDYVLSSLQTRVTSTSVSILLTRTQRTAHVASAWQGLEESTAMKLLRVHQVGRLRSYAQAYPNQVKSIIHADQDKL